MSVEYETFVLTCGSKRMTVGLVKVTPELAMKWLENSTNFRRTNDNRVNRYRLAIKSGIWELNGDTVKINRQGKCVDGGHRLQACILEKKPFITLVVFDVDKVVETDRGMARTLAQELEHRGYSYASSLATTLIYVWASKNLGKNSWSSIGSRKCLSSTTQCLEELEQHEDLLVALQFIAGKSLHLVSVGIMASTLAMALIHGGFDLGDASEFIEGLMDPDLRMSDPRRALREKLLANKAAKAKLGQLDLRSLIIKAWNAVQEGRSYSHKNSLRWDPSREEFPTLVKKEDLA